MRSVGDVDFVCDLHGFIGGAVYPLRYVFWLAFGVCSEDQLLIVGRWIDCTSANITNEIIAKKLEVNLLAVRRVLVLIRERRLRRRDKHTPCPNQYNEKGQLKAAWMRAFAADPLGEPPAIYPRGGLFYFVLFIVGAAGCDSGRSPAYLRAGFSHA